MTNKNMKIYLAGHKGMVGSSLCKLLHANGYTNLILRTKEELDLRNQKAVFKFFQNEKPEMVIIAAAKVGGILANNNYPYEFLMHNLQIQNNLIHGALMNGVEKLIFLGSSCIYPKFAKQPIKEEYLLTDSLEPTNEWYAIAKIAGVKACQSIRKQYKKEYISLMPTNLYGYNDNFDLESSHVLPAMIRKFHDAKMNNDAPVYLWGSGKPMREFLFVDDLARAIIFCLENKLTYDIYNIGTGVDISIKDLAMKIRNLIGHKGEILWDENKPDGTPRKLLDVSKINLLGWNYTTNLDEGIIMTYKWFLENINNYKGIK